MATIIVHIPPDGKSPVIKVEGHAGPGCHAMTANLERRLGAVANDVETDEMHEAPLGVRERATEE